MAAILRALRRLLGLPLCVLLVRLRLLPVSALHSDFASVSRMRQQLAVSAIPTRCLNDECVARWIARLLCSEYPTVRATALRRLLESSCATKRLMGALAEVLEQERGRADKLAVLVASVPDLAKLPSTGLLLPLLLSLRREGAPVEFELLLDRAILAVAEAQERLEEYPVEVSLEQIVPLLRELFGTNPTRSEASRPLPIAAAAKLALLLIRRIAAVPAHRAFLIIQRDEVGLLVLQNPRNPRLKSLGQVLEELSKVGDR